MCHSIPESKNASAFLLSTACSEGVFIFGGLFHEGSARHW